MRDIYTKLIHMVLTLQDNIHAYMKAMTGLAKRKGIQSLGLVTVFLRKGKSKLLQIPCIWKMNMTIYIMYFTWHCI
jgi:hypothetical protein